MVWFVGFVYLQKLVLQKQEKLSTLTLQCQCLQEVDLAGCESLTNSICDVFCDGGACPMLKSLVLDHCEVCKLYVNAFYGFVNVVLYMFSRVCWLLDKICLGFQIFCRYCFG